MNDSAKKTASILSRKHEESLRDGVTMLCVDWTEFRDLAGIAKLTNSYLGDVNKHLAGSNRTLIPLNDFLLVCHTQRLNYPSSGLLSSFLMETGPSDWALTAEKGEKE